MLPCSAFTRCIHAQPGVVGSVGSTVVKLNAKAAWLAMLLSEDAGCCRESAQRLEARVAA
ncbi:hypothetical protein KR100_01285 [Synechococcus sp. KORDI-100]|nr:hypothetical protein KR100_01285 [Synechococcus sp. KORDI-100]